VLLILVYINTGEKNNELTYKSLLKSTRTRWHQVRKR